MENPQRQGHPELTPELIAEITRRARIERSRTLWRMLQSLFGNPAEEDPRQHLPGKLEPGCP